MEDDGALKDAERLGELTKQFCIQIGEKKCTWTGIAVVPEDLKIVKRIVGPFSALQGQRHSWLLEEFISGLAVSHSVY